MEVSKLDLATHFPHIHQSFQQTTLLPNEKILVAGDPEIENRTKAFRVGVVGTRRPSHYGIQFVEELLEACAAYRDWIWVSGGALGIDGEMHRAALQRGLKTQAWLVGPIEDPNPRSHFQLFSQMKSRPGCALLVPEGVDPQSGARIRPFSWLERNRWLAADVDVLVVVEAHEKSGTWNTVTWALGFSKEVYLLPGSIFSESSRGTNRMISMGCGHVVESLTQVTKSLVVAFEERSYNYR